MAKKDADNDKLTKFLRNLLGADNYKPTPKVEKEIDDLVKKIMSKKSRMSKGGLAKKKPAAKKKK